MRWLIVSCFVALLFSNLPASADTAVDETFDCLSKPISDNLAFNVCLMQADQRVEESRNNKRKLESLAYDLDAGLQPILAEIHASLSADEIELMRIRLKDEGIPFFYSCINYKIEVELAKDGLANARCQTYAVFMILHFVYDNYAEYWAVE